MNELNYGLDEGSTVTTVTRTGRRLVGDHNCIVYDRDDPRYGFDPTEVARFPTYTDMCEWLRRAQ